MLSRAKSNLLYTKEFTFYKHHSMKDFVNCSFYLKQNNLIEFKGILFYVDTKEMKPNNEDQEK